MLEGNFFLLPCVDVWAFWRTHPSFFSSRLGQVLIPDQLPIPAYGPPAARTSLWLAPGQPSPSFFPMKLFFALLHLLATTIFGGFPFEMRIGLIRRARPLNFVSPPSHRWLSPGFKSSSFLAWTSRRTMERLYYPFFSHGGFIAAGPLIPPSFLLPFACSQVIGIFSLFTFHQDVKVQSGPALAPQSFIHARRPSA